MAGREPKSGSLSVTSVQQTTENARLVGRFHPPTSRSRQTKYRNSFKTTERREREGVADKILHLIPIRGGGGANYCFQLIFPFSLFCGDATVCISYHFTQLGAKLCGFKIILTVSDYPELCAYSLLPLV